MEPQPELLGRLTRVLASQPGESLPERLCAAFTQIVEAGGTAMTHGFSSSDRYLICASDAVAERIENMQDVVRQGPSLDAHRTLQPVSLTGSAQRDRWPLLVAALEERGPIPRIHAFPMMPATTVLGVVTSHFPAGSSLAVPLEEAQFLANAVGVAVLGELRPDDFADERWAVRDRISQATGMVVAQLGVAPADALAVLRAHAFAEDVTLADVSGRIVDRSLRFGSGDPGENR